MVWAMVVRVAKLSSSRYSYLLSEGRVRASSILIASIVSSGISRMGAVPIR